jgi:hypothetical protein
MAILYVFFCSCQHLFPHYRVFAVVLHSQLGTWKKLTPARRVNETAYVRASGSWLASSRGGIAATPVNTAQGKSPITAFLVKVRGSTAKLVTITQQHDQPVLPGSNRGAHAMDSQQRRSR